MWVSPYQSMIGFSIPQKIFHEMVNSYWSVKVFSLESFRLYSTHLTTRELPHSMLSVLAIGNAIWMLKEILPDSLDILNIKKAKPRMLIHAKRWSLVTITNHTALCKQPNWKSTTTESPHHSKCTQVIVAVQCTTTATKHASHLYP